MLAREVSRINRHGVMCGAPRRAGELHVYVVQALVMACRSSALPSPAVEEDAQHGSQPPQQQLAAGQFRRHSTRPTELAVIAAAIQRGRARTADDAT